LFAFVIIRQRFRHACLHTPLLLLLRQQALQNISPLDDMITRYALPASRHYAACRRAPPKRFHRLFSPHITLTDTADSSLRLYEYSTNTIGGSSRECCDEHTA